jgi:thermitase
MSKRPSHLLTLFYASCWFCLAGLTLRADDSLTWAKESNQVSADVNGMVLPTLLKRVAFETGWQVFVEPGTTHTSSAKFKELPAGDALRMLLGKLNFALIPQTNAASRLYVFKTAIDNATQPISPGSTNVARSKPVRVPNELIVRLKPGESIEELARRLGAKVVGSIPEINAYRLRFDSDEATQNAFLDLSNDTSVAGVDYNYYLNKPEPVQGVISSSGLPPQLQLKPASGANGVVVGVVDTAIQPLGNDLDKLITQRLSVAGEATAANNSPTHGTTMLESILHGMESTGASSTAARFVSVDVFGNNGTTSTFDVAAGIVLAVNNGANWINVSLGSDGSSPVLQNIIQTVTDRGVVIFAAAGNEPTGQPVYPAAYPGVVAVTATSSGQIAPYANMASFVDVAAPGAGIIYYQNRAYLVQGTSVSTAFTTGAAVGLAEKSGANWSQVQPALFNALALPAGTTK